jgi:hypothetical protein
MCAGRPFIRILSIVSALAHILATAHASDPINAFPTSEKPVEARVKELTAEQLRAIELPSKHDDVVFSIAKIPIVGPPTNTEPEPYLRVLADGRIDCKSLIGLPEVERRHDTLTKAELTWLLHLAVNECQVMRRTSRGIDDQYKKHPHGGLPPSPSFLYHVSASSRTNDLLIPENALVVKRLRAQLQLVPFASLNKYANFFIARAYLEPKERQPLLDELNTKLNIDLPDAPPFKFEHLGAAFSSPKLNLTAAFEQEIELEPNKFRRVIGTMVQKEKGGEPVCTFSSTEFSKYRPRESQ